MKNTHTQKQSHTETHTHTHIRTIYSQFIHKDACNTHSYSMITVTTRSKDATRGSGHGLFNKLLATSASLLVRSALLVVT